MFHWNVDPEIFSYGIIHIRYYSLLFMAGFVVGIYMFNWIYKRENKPLQDLDTLLVYMLVGTIVGARLGHCIFYDFTYYFSQPIRILMVWEGGLASHGAAIGILLALYLYTKKRPDQPFLWLVDRIVIAVALAGSFIRLGNFFNSEIIGRPTDVPWAVIFDRVDAIPRHPTQIYEALAYFLIFLFLFFKYKKLGAKTPQGHLFGLFLILVFGFRFFVEFLKENQSAFEAQLPLNMGQILSIPLVIFGFYLLLRQQKQKSGSGNGKKE
ncbi:prolipoprotein diacylglyceryl transferase [Calditrichota bacterium LG25]